MKKSQIVVLAAFLIAALFVGVGPDVRTGLAAQRNLRENRPPRKAAVIRKKKAAQPGPVYWVRDILQGYALDSLLPTSDDGLLVSGWSSVPYKLWLIKFSSDGTVAWTASRTTSTQFGGLALNGMIPTADGDIVGAGNVSTTSREVAVVKFTNDGQVLWAYSYGGPYADDALGISQAQDGGFLVTGVSLSPRGNDGSEDRYYIWLIKLDIDGIVQWERAFACLDEETFFREGGRNVSGVQLADGSYVVAANTRIAGSGEFDYLLIKLDAQGNVEWQRTYGGAQFESLFQSGPHLEATADGGMILAGSTTSFGSGNTDIWILKLAPDGSIEWQKAIGSPDYEYCNSIRVTPDGGYLLAGDAGGRRFGLIKLSPAGDIEWDRAFGGHYAKIVSIAKDGSYILGGVYGTEIIIMKTSSGGLISDTCGFADPPQHFVTTTDAVPVSVSFEPYTTPLDQAPFTASFDKGLAVFTELVCWNFNQPPVPKPVARTINRGLFRGEAFNTLTWDPHPANATLNIAQYRIYAKVAGSAASDFRVIGTVPGNYLAYVDSRLDMSTEYEYALTSVDAEGHESPKSIVIGGNFVDQN